MNQKFKTILNRSLWRCSYLSTLFHGPEFRPTLNCIEIDITYRCDLFCLNCNRSCTQAPSNLSMDVSQIQKFIDESIQTNTRWRRIRILGGEPFLHPQIKVIIEKLSDYQIDYNSEVQLEIVTNGYGAQFSKINSEISNKFLITNTHKMSSFGNKFDPFNLAPRDNWRFILTDYANGCWIPTECGIGLTYFGYYQCAVAGGIDRVLGKNIGLKKLPQKSEEFIPLMRKLCSWCGHFFLGKKQSSKLKIPLNQQISSKSWRKAYEMYAQIPTSLIKY